MSYRVITFKKKTFLQSLKSNLHYRFVSARLTFQHYKIGVIMILKNETRWYYDYYNKKVFVMDGLEYIIKIRVDLGEVAYFNTKQGAIRAELF